MNVAQGFREPVQWWRQSGRAAARQAAYDAFRVVRRRYGQVPGGMFGGDEVCRPGRDDARQAIETCALVEQLRSELAAAPRQPIPLRPELVGVALFVQALALEPAATPIGATSNAGRLTVGN